MPTRLIIYPRDVMNITGKSKNASNLLLTKLRQQLNKPERSLITVEEFCRFTGLNEIKVKEFLK